MSPRATTRGRFRQRGAQQTRPGGDPGGFCGRRLAARGQPGGVRRLPRRPLRRAGAARIGLYLAQTPNGRAEQPGHRPAEQVLHVFPRPYGISYGRMGSPRVSWSEGGPRRRLGGTHSRPPDVGCLLIASVGPCCFPRRRTDQIGVPSPARPSDQVSVIARSGQLLAASRTLATRWAGTSGVRT